MGQHGTRAELSRGEDQCHRAYPRDSTEDGGPGPSEAGSEQVGRASGPGDRGRRFAMGGLGALKQEELEKQAEKVGAPRGRETRALFSMVQN